MNMFRSKTLCTVRIVSYNVLSPNLATAASYPTLNPDYLDPSKRLEVVLQKLEHEMAQPRAIICLQEVTYEWAGSLHSFFANRGYHFVTGLYGRPFNGYMGVAMAWPTASFETLDVDISRLSDTREAGWPREPEEEEEDLLDKPCFPLFTWLFSKKKKPTDEKPPLDPWEYSERRFNVLLTATLKEKETGQKLCIGNYHMPCAFYAPQVMTIHCDMAARRVQKLAQEQVGLSGRFNENKNDKNDNTPEQLPYIVAGDWNIKPGDPAYQLMTTGTLSQEDPAFPVPAKSKRTKSLDQVLMTWKPTIQAMRSVYATTNDGNEPKFTNWAAPRTTMEEDEGFMDTLDYIFVSPEWTVMETGPVKNPDEAQGPFPNMDPDVREPSDHILISAKLALDSSGR